MDDTVAIVGFGRFGRTLAQLMDEAGLRVRAWEPSMIIPAPYRAASLRDAVRDAGVVVPAVPVTALSAVLEAMRPLVSPEALVIDVSSVKQGPVQALAATLGAEVPWVATHPLFGPSSIALGERPLWVVVCPNAMHPEATRRARRFWERVGCDVVIHDAQEQDRLMARTHAMAFFVAKAMLDIGAGERLPFAPPSFRAMTRTIEAVREDAAHLFLTIQVENPFAAEERERLLTALSSLHRDLLAARDTAGVDQQALDLPALHRPADLKEIRELIDALDLELLDLLARRAHLAGRAGRAKREAGQPVRDTARERELLEARRVAATARGLDPAAVTAVFETILTLSRDAQVSSDP